MRVVLSILLAHVTVCAFAQQTKKDSVQNLEPVLIQAYATGRPLAEVPAAIGYINTENLNRFNNTSILPAVNTIPGVRMEERSPGSFRFSIRGSLLRSPFGVRNVKMYWNGLPLTDGGGNTYLNLIDFNSIGSVEIIKGPGGSLYGAGTGGVVLLSSPAIRKDQVELSTSFGSFGLQRYQLAAQSHSDNMNIRLQYAHQQYDGYREQTKMKRESFNADLAFYLNPKSALSATFFYTDLYYQTPGGLTKAQLDANPKQARPPGGPNKGAVEQQAAVYNKTPYVGLSYDYDWSERWSTRIGVFGSHSKFDNPTIRNYEHRNESNAGARTETQYKFSADRVKGKLTFGAEYQNFNSPIRLYGNVFGSKDTLQTDDKLSSRLFLLFIQQEIDLPANFSITAGLSVNYLHFGYSRRYPTSFSEQRNLEKEFSPRIALLNQILPGISIYASYSRGFSPPSIAELYPSRAIFDKNIQSEKGTNLEIGIRGDDLKSKINFDFTAYNFQLNNTLVIRRDPNLPGNPDYFVNAGATTQKGIEATASWTPINNQNTFISRFKIWNSYSLNRYRFNNYFQDVNDYSGNKLTGVPATVNSSGLDMIIKKAVYLNLTGYYVDHIPLNDANTAYASEYFLIGGRIGFKSLISKQNPFDLFFGVDNALDKKYSLGNDLNAVGGRYYNPAAPRNFYIGFKLSFVK